MPVPPAPQPSGVRLFIEGVRFEALAYSSAGVTVPPEVLDLQPELRRGTPCPATLQVFGEMYGVILRLAARAEGRVEFAFVSLAPQARRALEHYAAAEPAEPPRPLGLAFAEALGRALPADRRLVLPESEGVYALTVGRQRPAGLPAASAGTDLAVPSDPGLVTITGRVLLASAAGLLALLSAVAWALA
jgi:hypothetical protein